MPDEITPSNERSVSAAADDAVVEQGGSFFASEDWWSIVLGWTALLLALSATWFSRPPDIAARVERYEMVTRHLDAAAEQEGANTADVKLLRADRDKAKKALAVNPVRPWLAKLGDWKDDPRKAFVNKEGKSILRGLAGAFAVSLILFAAGLAGRGESIAKFAPAFAVVFLLATFAFVLAGQEVVKNYNLEYALWALVVGLLISNTVGTPAWLKPAARTEFYIKTGLVLLGAEILFHQLLALGVPGIFVSWVVTPIVLISTYIFGQRVLKIESRSLNMVISADMSVCGVSAAIATAAACRAKKEELSLAIGLSLTVTVAMMVVMPGVIKAAGMSEVLGGAWIGGTIDSTGAVAAAGGLLGDTALAVATTVKMIQNILIGVIAFGVAVYWVTYVERDTTANRPGAGEIWRRFPKFVLGFLAASFLFSIIAARGAEGEAIVSAATGASVTLRGWFFCLAFVSIGLETNFRELKKFFVGGKPLILYVCGQTLNLILTLAMAWLMFEKVFPDAAKAIGK